MTVDGRSAEEAEASVPPEAAVPRAASNAATAAVAPKAARPAAPPDDRYKWVALTNTTAGVLLATIDASILIIAMPDIFRGIELDPLVPGNSVYLLWMILGYLVTGSVLVVSLGRLGDMYGRVRMYNLGFVIYTVGVAAS